VRVSGRLSAVRLVNVVMLHSNEAIIIILLLTGEYGGYDWLSTIGD